MIDLQLLGELATLPQAFAALMPVINPFGTALLILGMVGAQPRAVYEKLARQVAGMMLVFVLAVLLVGQWLLHFFGISLPVLQLGGGLTLAAMGWRTLSGATHAAQPAQGQGEGVLAGAFYPYTFPLTTGPGTLVVLLTLSAHASRPSVEATAVAHLGILLGAALQAVLVYVCYRYAPRLQERLSHGAIVAIQQLMAFILLCIGGQIAWGGVSALIGSLPH